MKSARIREGLLLGAVVFVHWMGATMVGINAAEVLAFASILLLAHVAMWALAPEADPLLLPLAGLLCSIGLIQIAAIDAAKLSAGGDWKSLGGAQLVWMAVSVVAFVGTMIMFRTGLGPVWRYRYTFALAGGLALVAPLLPFVGRTINGATLWLRIGGISFQPGEIAKVLFVLFLAAYLSERRELLGVATRWRLGPIPIPDPKYMAPLGLIVGGALFVLFQANDLGASLLFFLTFTAILWVATGKVFYPLAGLVSFSAGVWVLLTTVGRIGVRFEGWLHPEYDPQVTGYQLLVGQYAMAEGGIGGVGLISESAQPNIIPYGWTDLILASIGHTLGLAGVLVVITALILLLTRIFHVGLRSSSDLHALACSGLGIVLGVQAALIAGGVLRVLPLTGVTLPFVSYGGSSLVSNFVILGLVAVVSNTEKTTANPNLREAA